MPQAVPAVEMVTMVLFDSCAHSPLPAPPPVPPGARWADQPAEAKQNWRDWAQAVLAAAATMRPDVREKAVADASNRALGQART
jgi:hypothetical protein